MYSRLSEGVEICDNCRYITGNCGVLDYETGKFADNATYSFDTVTGTLTISGEGVLGDNVDSTWQDSWCKGIKSVIIDDKITTIGASVFACFESLTSITIPDGVMTLGDDWGDVFYECTSLKNITAPCRLKGNESIANAISNGATVTYKHIFDEDAETCVCGDAITGSCGVLDYGTLEYANNATYVFDKATGTLTISGTGAVGAEAFPSWNIDWYDEIKTVVIGDGITEIDMWAFYGCSSLTDITAPCTVKYNESVWKEGCNANVTYTHLSEGVEICDNCKYIKGNCGAYHEETDTYDDVTYKFDKLTGTLTISGTGAVNDYAFDAEWADDKEKEFASDIKTVVIENGITSIGNEAFFGCSSLKSITASCAVKYDESSWKDGCNANVTYTHLSEGVEICDNCKYIKGNCGAYHEEDVSYKFDKLTGTLTISGTGAIKGSAFAVEYADDKEKEFASDIKTVVIENGITSIGEQTFYKCSSLTTVEMNSVTSIGEYAFGSCKSLSSVKMKNVTSVGNAAFNGCEALTLVEMNSVTSIGDFAFENCKLLKTVEMNSVTSIDYGAFIGCSSLKSVEMNSVTSIENRAFEDCIALTSVTLGSTVPDGLNKIPTSAEIIVPCTLNGNAALAGRNITYKHTEVTIEGTDATCTEKGLTDKVYCSVCETVLAEQEEISATGHNYVNGECTACGNRKGNCGENATYVFDKATGLLTISGTGAVESEAFASWNIDWYDEIKTVVIESGITSIGECAFFDCSSLETVEMNSVTSIGNNVFDGCSSLTSVEMNSVTSIGGFAFSNCSALTTIKMNSVKSIESQAFYGCDSLTSVTLGSEVPDGLLDSYIPDTAKLIIPAEAYENYKNLGYNLGFSDIKGIGYILEGQIGIRLATDLSADKLVVMCGDKTIDLTQKTGYVEFYLSAQDMAKEYTVYYVDGEIEIAKFNPKNNLSGYEDTKYAEVAKALITYCETANAYFNGGEIADMSSEYDDVINAITPNTVDMGEDYDSSSLILESNTIVRHYYTKDAEGRIKKGNYYYVEEAVDPTKFARTDTYSVNDYIYKVLNSDKADANLKNLCVVLYKYGEAAKGYIKHTHTPVTDPAVAQTCTETGLTEGSHCSVCGEVIVAQEVISATGHTKTTDKAIAPTCTADGLTEGSHCSVCGEVIVAQEVISATGHTKVTDKAIAPTCTTKGLTEGSHCSVCGEVIVAQKNISASHTKVIDTPSVAATCTADGRTEGSHCSVCNAIISTSTTIAPLGHNYSEGYCRRCGEKDTSFESYSFNYTMTEPLEAEPAGQIVKIAKQYESEITISCNGKTAKCTKSLAIIGLGAKKGDEVTVTAKGSDAGAAIVEVMQFFGANL